MGPYTNRPVNHTLELRFMHRTLCLLKKNLVIKIGNYNFFVIQILYKIIIEEIIKNLESENDS